LSIQYYKAIIFCYQKKFDYALQHLNDALSTASRISYVEDRFKILLEKLEEKLKRKDDIDMSYISPSLLKNTQQSNSK
jgi:hypothetical protein